MINRRKFIESSAFGTAGLIASQLSGINEEFSGLKGKPIVISTWAPNIKANAAAWEVLGSGGRALDAVVKGVQVPEADPTDNSVGYGGLPDRDGKVTLDSCVMDEFGNCGSVMALEHIMHPVLVARMVMEKTPHVQLVGDGALQFALEQGFKKENLLTEASEKAWKEWLKKSDYDPMRSVKEIEEKMEKEKKKKDNYPWPVALLNHDTIGMVAMDTNGNLGGACTTSGMAFKMHGRVGDSPIIGAGLFVDNEVGAASATGLGEEVVRICGAHTIVESMRRGLTPEMACKEAVRRIVKRNGVKAKSLQVGFLAINNKGLHGGFAVQKGFNYCVTTKEGTKVIDAKSWFS
ncbi:MAG TPA: N(4)-(beta-N-acetylglucosaminyl)-L-asparaginase [Chitinophagaceae bacterium]|nr:N(4)-(beta-N-acetylglucosaminyl)-L-asparaginase [Chitinophagaceae bacterium]